MSATRWKAPTYKELQGYADELEPLYKQASSIERKILRLVNKRNKVRDKLDQEAVESISDISKLTAAQWRWVLRTGHDESMVHHKFREKVLSTLGLSTFGYMEETLQPLLALHPYGFNKDTMAKSLAVILRHMKPVTVEDSRHGTERGVRIMVHGVSEDMTAVCYIHEDRDVTLYLSRYGEPKKFKKLTDFLAWYEENKSAD